MNHIYGFILAFFQPKYYRTHLKHMILFNIEDGPSWTFSAFVWTARRPRECS